MGLDMYMTRKHYVKNWDFDTRNFKVTVTQNDKPLKGLDESKISYVIEDVAYWRKANAIHYWLVQNVQNGTDDCGDYYVDDDKLEELVNLCKQVVEVAKTETGQIVNGYTWENGEKKENLVQGTKIINPEEVAAILPTESGFFFGSTEYDEYYLQDIKDTIEQLEPLLEKDDKGDFLSRAEVYYRSSW